MGKGIALQYKKRFPDMYKSYVQLCERNELQPGKLFLWTKSKPWILNFPTKYHWKYPSKIEYIEKGLIKFTNTYQNKGITSIAFPQLGTNAGGLDWSEVRTLMHQYLSPLKSIEIEIYIYDPQISDDLFNNFSQMTLRFQSEDYIKYLKITKRQAELIIKNLSNCNINNMQDFEKVKGLGDKTIEKIYDFILNNTNKRIVTLNEEQPSLF